MFDLVEKTKMASRRSAAIRGTYMITWIVPNTALEWLNRKVCQNMRTDSLERHLGEGTVTAGFVNRVIFSLDFPVINMSFVLGRLRKKRSQN